MKIDKKLLESLEDITGQLQRDKVTTKQVIETLSHVVNYYRFRDKTNEITYDMVLSYNKMHDHQCSDGYILDILQGDINIENYKKAIIQYNKMPDCFSPIQDYIDPTEK